MKVTAYIARRLALHAPADERTRQRNANPGIAIAIAGVAIAVIVMELTLAVVTGFRNEITRRVLGTQPTITLTGQVAVDAEGGYTTEPFVRVTPDLQALLAAHGLDNATMTFSRPAVLKTPNDFEAIMLTAHNNGPTDFEKTILTDGAWPADSMQGGLALSRYTASRLGLTIGDKVDIAFITANGDMKMRRQAVTGLFESNFGDYDHLTAFAPAVMLRQVEGVDSLTATSVDFFAPVPDMQQLAAQAADLQSNILQNYSIGVLNSAPTVDNVAHTGAMYFNWLDLLDTNVVVIFVLMTAVAGFTLVSCLFIILLERIRLIGMLRALGMPRRQVRQIFMLVGVRLVLWGLLIGNIVALGLIFAQRCWHFLRLDPKMYYLDVVPMQPIWWQILILNIAIVVAGYIILVIPAAYVARIKPAATLRFE